MYVRIEFVSNSGKPGGRNRAHSRARRPGFLLLAVSTFVASTATAGDGGGEWDIELPQLPTARRLLAAAAEGDLIFTFGGCGSPCFQPPFHTSTFEETRLEIFDTETL